MTFDRTDDVTAPRARFLSRLSSRKLQLDLALGFLLACGVFVLYTRTLVPSVLDGDQGEFQFIPAVLGIPHPSGFPLYVLLGHLWSAIPVGTLAYRMNLFSAFLGALTVGSLYIALRSQKLLVLAALGAALTLALIPQFWEYSTVAAVYRLHNLLIVLLFAFLAQWERTKQWLWLELGALAFGLDIANHLTIVFFAPATLILLLMVSGRDLFKKRRVILVGGLLLSLPLLLYGYFPLRGSQLVSSTFALPGWNMAVAQGIVSPFYDSSPSGLFQYIIGGTFFKSVTGHWQWRLDTLFPDWTGILLQTVNWPILVLALVGSFVLAKQRPKLAVWLIIVVLTFQLLALQYSYAGLASIGQFSSYFREYYLPSFIALIALMGWGIDGLVRVLASSISRFGPRSRVLAGVVPSLVALAFLGVAANDLAAHRSDSLTARSAEIQTKWDTIKKYPPDQGAAIVGHWGDLTPLWYYQYAEGWRSDLVTINPPDEGMVDAWMKTGKPLYIAGSLLDWAPGIARTYYLTPWGPLVRVTKQSYVAASPLSNGADWTFKDDRPRLKLSGYDMSRRQLRVGENLNVAAYWQVINAVKLDDVALFLSLGTAQDDTPALSYAPVVNWLPGGRLVTGQRALGTYSYPVPWGTQPGTYRLLLSLYSTGAGRTLTATHGTESVTSIDLGEIQVEAPSDYPDTAETDHPANANFGNRIALLGWDGNLGKVAPGDTPTMQLLWKGGGQNQNRLMASVALENAAGSHPLGDQAIADQYPSDRWRPGEIVLDQRSFTLPADLPDGDYALTLRVRDGAQNNLLEVYDGWFPRGDNYTLAHVHAVGRTHSYVLPSIPHPETADFDGRLRMLGYALGANKLHGGDSVHLSLYWQAQSLMSSSLKFFVHIVDGEGHLLAQHDDIPGQGALPTTSWLPGEVVIDAFDLALPGESSPGKYQFQVGFYDAVTGARLNVKDANGAVTGDHILLTDGLEVTDK